MNNSNQQQPNPFPELEKIEQQARRTTDRVERLRLMQQWTSEAKVIQAEGQGRIKQLELQRAQEYGCPTDELAQEMIQELEGDVAELERELESGVEILMGEMGWTG